MDGNQERTLETARILVNNYQDVLNRDEETSEEDSDAIYKEYWHLIYDNFGNKMINLAEQKIGLGKFTTLEFLDALEEVIENAPRIVDEYQGYVLKRCKDCWGDMSYFVYLNNRQYSESLDYLNDEVAIKYFRHSIDDQPGDPNFYD